MLESVSKVETVLVERELWGQIEIEEEEEVDEEEEYETETEENEMEMENTVDEPGVDIVEPMGLDTPSGMVSTVVPIPESLELRKSRFDVGPPTESQ